MKSMLGMGAALFAAATVSSHASAGVVQTHVIDFFDEEPGPVAQMLRLFLPQFVGNTIVETRLFIDFTPLPGYSAGDFYLLVAPPVAPDPGEDGFLILDTSTDFGWSGQGTFHFEGTFTNLNGVIQPGLWGYEVFPTIDPPILEGFFSASTRWEIDMIPSPGVLAAFGACAPIVIRRRRTA